jgi:hypothetical protein
MYPSYSYYQIIGMIDIAVTSTDLGINRNFGTVLLITTGDTVISGALKTEATLGRVVLCQAIVMEIPGNTAAQSLFFIMPSTLQNPEVIAQIGAQSFQCIPLPNVPIPWQPVQGVPDPTDPDPIGESQDDWSDSLP